MKSTLQRARATLDGTATDRDLITDPADPVARKLLETYIAGFEHADTDALERALRTDAAIELVGTGTWFQGRVTCLSYLADVIGAPGDWRMIPTTANGQPAAATYLRDGSAFGLGVLTTTPTGISRIVVFGGDAELVARFGLPPVHKRITQPDPPRRPPTSNATRLKAARPT